MSPGEYRLLDSPLLRRVSSARELAPLAYDDRRYYRSYGAYEAYPRVVEPAVIAPAIIEPRYSALEVYTLPGFRGSTMRFDGGASALNRTVTSQGVSSLIVREGVWELCTGMDHTGSCRVYEPGRYPRLGSYEGAPVGSLRRVG
jgi:hypothetical protein